MHVNKCTLSWRARPNWGHIQHAPRVPADHVTCAERKNLLVSLLTQESAPFFCAHTHTHAHSQRQRRRKSTYKRSERLLLFLLSLFISLRPPFLFFFTSCNTGKYANHGVATVSFSQWEHSVIPAGLGHRVNTFFSQARNSLAEAGVRRGGSEGWREREG